jgi:hypothetical protein
MDYYYVTYRSAGINYAAWLTRLMMAEMQANGALIIAAAGPHSEKRMKALKKKGVK